MPNVLNLEGYTFNREGWINAAQAAKKFGKRPNDCLELPSTAEYMNALVDTLGLSVTRKSGNGLVFTMGKSNYQKNWYLKSQRGRYNSAEFPAQCQGSAYMEVRS